MGEHCDQCQVTLSQDPGSTRPQDGPGPPGHPRSQILAATFRLTQPSIPIPGATLTPHWIPPLPLTSDWGPCPAPAPIPAPPRPCLTLVSFPIPAPSTASSATSARWSAKRSAHRVSQANSVETEPNPTGGPGRLQGVARRGGVAKAGSQQAGRGARGEAGPGPREG